MHSASTPLAWLLVGPGDIASRRVAPALRDTPGSRLAAICGRAGSSKAAALAARTGGPAVFDDYDRALAESGADAVYIATQPRLHAAMVCKALAAGKHVFCEKPLGCDAGECLAMLRARRAAVEKQKRGLMQRLLTGRTRTGTRTHGQTRTDKD